MSKNGAATRFCNDIVGPTAYENIAIVGSGAWGTALALTARRAGRQEGAANASSIVRFAAERGVEMAICTTVERVLHGLPVDHAIRSRLASDLRPEAPTLENGPRIHRPERRKSQEGVSA